LKLSLDIKRLVSEAYPHTDQTTRDELAVDSFVKAIHNLTIRFELKIRPVKTIDEARMMAERIQMAVLGERGTNSTQIHHMVAKTQVKPDVETDQEGHVKRKRFGNDQANSNSKNSLLTNIQRNDETG
jgi:hypothetical protein